MKLETCAGEWPENYTLKVLEALAKESFPYCGAILRQAAMVGGTFLGELVELSKGRSWSS